MSAKNVTIIMSGGVGHRFGADRPKQYVKLNGRCVIDYVIDAVKGSELTDEVVVVMDPSCIDYSEELKNSGFHFALNGKERPDSLNSAFEYIKDHFHECERIIILDAVAPLVTSELIDDYLAKLDEYDAVITCQKITGALGNYDFDPLDREKYYMTHRWLKKLIPELKICEMTRINYQQLLNDYALYHERQTTMDFHHQLKGAILDAVDEGLLDRDPTRKAIIKGKTPAVKKIKYINQFELHTLLNNLNLKSEISWDWFILIVAKTGLRFSEALALTPKDFDFGRQSISVSKTWDYKGDGGFLPTKNKSSVRKVQIDWQTVIQFSELIKGLSEDKPIFVNGKVYNSTVNDILARYCKKANVPVISVHGLRHTHASLLLFAGVSIASVARRLGHSSMNTTQKTYLHIIQELESQDVDLVMRSLSGLS